MRIGIIGDIHGNIDGLKAMLEALDRAKVDRICCTGDIVGYGACPQQCIDILRQRNIECVKGNHDEYVTQIGGNWKIQPDARAAILWTQQNLSDEHLDWLRALPRLINVEDIQILHSSHAWWPRWSYVINERTAVHNFMFQPSQVTFNGHTHVPLCVTHQPKQTPRVDVLRNMFLPRKQRLLIGVGSVGQPRDGDPRSCGVVYDSETKSIRMVRVNYNIEAAHTRIINAGLPADLATRLFLGR